MGEAKWTAGPWKLVDNGNDVYACGAGTDDRVVCDFAAPYYAETGPDDTALANAALVIAAPDLYAALEEMVEKGEGCVTGRDDCGPECCRCGRARAALARARGEEPSR
jgi:hypothetical protein